METSSAAGRLTSRFIAGSTLEQALAICEKLNREGMLATLDHLGESVTSLAEAEGSRDSYLAALDRIAELGLKASISIKLTQLGLNFSEEQCRANVERLVERAQATGSAVEVDMESSEYVDRTLSLVSEYARPLWQRSRGDSGVSVPQRERHRAPVPPIHPGAAGQRRLPGAVRCRLSKKTRRR